MAWKQQLHDYLLDSKSLFADRKLKDVAKENHNLTNDEELARERFQRDIIFLNFFFDTQIITQIKLEMRVSTFDKLSLIGGTMGLFTGISIITLIEIIWWMVQFLIVAFRQKVLKKYNGQVSSINGGYLQRM